MKVKVVIDGYHIDGRDGDATAGKFKEEGLELVSANSNKSNDLVFSTESNLVVIASISGGSCAAARPKSSQRKHAHASFEKTQNDESDTEVDHHRYKKPRAHPVANKAKVVESEDEETFLA